MGGTGAVTSFLVQRIQEISGLTMKELVHLKATLHIFDDKRFSCTDCLHKYKSRVDGEKQTQILQKSMGCETPFPRPVHNIDGEILFDRCIGNYFSHQAVHWITIHTHFQRGVLPFPGSLSEQPAKVLEIFSVIETHRANVETKRALARQRGAMKPGGLNG
jgi:hypothetical protein